MKFKAAIFDFDGTITERGVPYIDDDMILALIELAKKIPIAFCTGRNLESFVRRGLHRFMENLDEKLHDDILKNVYLLAENGSVGYFYDTVNKEYEEFYRIDWPESFVPMEKLKKDISEAVKDWGELFENAHKAVVVYRTVLYDIDNRSVDEVYELSRKIYETTVEYLSAIDKDFGSVLHVGDSGIGVLIVPADGDKDAGVKHFAEYLSKNFNYTFDKNLKDILIVGDRPQFGGNDFYLLNSNIGTSYTVGEEGVGKTPPLPVIDKSGKKLFNSRGTLYLINEALEFLKSSKILYQKT